MAREKERKGRLVKAKVNAVTEAVKFTQERIKAEVRCERGRSLGRTSGATCGDCGMSSVGSSALIAGSVGVKTTTKQAAR